jgi:hypothetical protein
MQLGRASPLLVVFGQLLQNSTGSAEMPPRRTIFAAASIHYLLLESDEMGVSR